MKVNRTLRKRLSITNYLLSMGMLRAIIIWGRMHEAALGVDKNLEEAFKCYQAAASLENTRRHE